MRKDSSRTLLFTSSESNKLFAVKEGNTIYETHAVNGIYSCEIGHDDDDQCVDPQRVADGRGPYTSHSSGLLLMNLQFFVSSSTAQDASAGDSIAPETEESNGDSHNDDGNNYLYGAAVYDHTPEYGFKLFSYEIKRAIPQLHKEINGTNTDLQFYTYFKTVQDFDWNNCEFNCCPFNDKPDSNGYQTHRDRHDWQFMQSFIRTVPRDFAVDERTGEIFIAWEGFYKNCNPANHFEVSGMLEWTIGVSRLKTEDPECVSVMGENGEPPEEMELGNNFGKCTEPVSIIYVGREGRDVILPYGGFTVIPAAAEPPAPGVKARRTFLLSAFQPGDGELLTQLWAIPENADATKNRYKRQLLSSSRVGPHIKEMGTWNGGNIKVHYNERTGRPDHLCRSVFDKGIRCMPIEVTEDADSVYVTVTGDEETFLTENQVHSFCVPPRDVALMNKCEPLYEDKSTVATGLDVVWNEKDGSPQRVFFGCWGMRSNGKLGSVERDGANLKNVLPGAYSGDVVFLPRELDATTVRIPLAHEEGSLHLPWPTAMYGIGAAGLLLAVGLALYGFHRKKSRRGPSTTTGAEKHSERRPGGGPVTYMELPVLSGSNSSSDSSGEAPSPNELT